MMPYKDPEVRRAKNREYQKKYYRSNSDYYKRRAREYRNNIRSWLREYKRSLVCCQCGENHPACLDFHHVDGEKERLISDMARNGCSIESILEEIKSCIVLCANCHRKEHWEEG